VVRQLTTQHVSGGAYIQLSEQKTKQHGDYVRSVHCHLIMLQRTVLTLSLLQGWSVVSFDFLGEESEGMIRQINYMEQELPQFMGNRTHRDYFKLLKQDGLSVLVGARNMVYNLSLPDLTENEHEVRVTFKFLFETN
jgi:hypothetical protein